METKLLAQSTYEAKTHAQGRAAAARPRFADLADTLARLQRKGLITGAGESLSLRIPGRDHFLFTALAERTQTRRGPAGAAQLYDFAGRAAGDAPHSDADAPEFAGIHAAIYAARPDVGAVLWNRQAWGAALHAANAPMPTIFDEQARQMGPTVERLPTDAFASKTGANALSSGANAFLFRDGVLLLGMTRERVVFNAELLEKCARAYLLALATGEPVGRIPLYVRVVAHRRLLKDERRSAAAYARGEIPTGFTAY